MALIERMPPITRNTECTTAESWMRLGTPTGTAVTEPSKPMTVQTPHPFSTNMNCSSCTARAVTVHERC